MNPQSPQVRRYLYDGCKFEPLLDPVNTPDDLSSPLVIDLTFDVTNTSRIYHPNTEKIRELVAKADAVVCETEAMASLVRMHTKQIVVTAPFGHCLVQDAGSDGLTVGLLNHDPDYQLNNAGAKSRKLLKGLSEGLLVYGDPLDYLEDCEVVEDFGTFASRCDILLLPSLEREVSSVALPLSMMLAGTVLLASGCNRGFYSLNPASGVMLLESFRVKDWKRMIDALASNGRQLDSLKQFNMRYARRVSDESRLLVNRLERKIEVPTAVYA